MTIPVALVTGASRGLGRGIAIELARNGWSVGINYALCADGSAAPAEETAKLCKEVAKDPGQRFVPLSADMSVPAERTALVENCVKELGRIDSLVNNAGIAPAKRLDITEATEESFDRLISINTKGPYFLTQAVANYWLKSKPTPAAKYFSVIFITSCSANTASIARGDYCISKAAGSMSAMLWATRLAAEGAMVYEIRPGIMKTDMTTVVTAKYDALIAQGLVPQMRWGLPEDVGVSVNALVSGAFPYATGSIINIDGGMQMRRL